MSKAYILHINDPLSLSYAEDCLESCREHGVEAVMIEGIKGKTNDEIEEMSGLKLGRSDHDKIYANEFCATYGHVWIWNKIAESDDPCVVLEHDVIVKASLNDIEVNDGEILFLGPRVTNRSDYKFPGQPYSKIPVRRFEGAHAYAITPNTARYMLDLIKDSKRIFIPVDGLLGIRNMFKLNLVALDPPAVVCEVGNRKSFAFGDKPVSYNFINTPGFLAGIEDETKLLPTRDYKFSVDWFSMHIPHWEETLRLVGKSKSDKMSILEIGSYEGKSGTWISDNLLDHPQSMLLCVDTFEGSIEHEGQDNIKILNDIFSYNISLSKNAHKTITAVGDSKEILPDAKSRGMLFDLIYVDGSHQTEDVIADGRNAYELLNDGGVIIFDDSEWSMDGITYPVKEALNVLEKELPIEAVLTGWQRSYIKKKE